MINKVTVMKQVGVCAHEDVIEDCIPGQTSDGYHTFDELYEHRNLLFAVLCNMFPTTAWKSKKHDNGEEWEGWFIAGIDLGRNRPITYHIPIDMWDLFQINEYSKAPEWDGHTSQDVINRLRETLDF